MEHNRFTGPCIITKILEDNKVEMKNIKNNLETSNKRITKSAFSTAVMITGMMTLTPEIKTTKISNSPSIFSFKSNNSRIVGNKHTFIHVINPKELELGI